MLCYVM